MHVRLIIDQIYQSLRQIEADEKGLETIKQKYLTQKEALDTNISKLRSKLQVLEADLYNKDYLIPDGKVEWKHFKCSANIVKLANSGDYYCTYCDKPGKGRLVENVPGVEPKQGEAYYIFDDEY